MAFNGNGNGQVKIVPIIIFILVVLLVLYILYVLWSNYNNTLADSPWLIKGTRIARTTKIIPANVIQRSKDGQFGIEMSYTLWLYVNDWTYGGNNFTKNSINFPKASSLDTFSTGVFESRPIIFS